MIYQIYKNNKLVNRIVADEAFCQKHYSTDGYSYELEAGPEQTSEELPEPTLEERNRADIDFIASYTGVPL